jgi:hypothetical protein
VEDAEAIGKDEIVKLCALVLITFVREVPEWFIGTHLKHEANKMIKNEKDVIRFILKMESSHY